MTTASWVGMLLAALLYLLIPWVALGLFSSRPAWAEIGEGQPIQASGDKEVWNRAKNTVELFGHAVVRQMGESLKADYITLNQNTRTLDAKGNCVYITSDAVIYGQEMHFNLDTRTGTVIGGRVMTDKFTLAGDRINKLGADRFQTHWGQYSTCRDCPQSWTFQAKDVDMKVDGYAFMSDVRLKIKDVSALWFPYLILPMKTRRQSGFLFPRWALSSQDGFVYVQPYFWAINRSSDMTFGLGTYADRGLRAEWEGRYALSPRSQGIADFYFLHDKTFASGQSDAQYNPSHRTARWGLDVSQTQELPWHLEEKLRVIDASDNLYPFRFVDLSQKQEPYLESSFNVAFASPEVSANLNARVYRNLLNLGPDVRTFDTATVQAYPSLAVTTNDRYLFHTGLVGGITFGLTDFTRGAGGYDDAAEVIRVQQPSYNPSTFPIPGVDPLRKATRFSLTPSLYTAIHPIDGVSLIPSVEYNAFYYLFQDAPGIPPLYRAYPLMQLDLTTEIDRIYDTGNPDVPRRKHLIRPFLTYSNIPFVQTRADHPFVQQIEYARQNFHSVGFNFDDNDIVPRDTTPTTTNYFVPLGNSLSYGFTTQLIDRVGAMDSDSPSYRMPMEWSVGQTFNFREFQVNPSNPQPFSRLFSSLKTNYLDKFTTDTTYYYYPYLPGIRHYITTSLQYIIERGFHKRVMAFDRSLALNYTWDQIGYNGTTTTNVGTNQATGTLNFSINDYLLPSLSGYYNFITHRMDGWGWTLAFQSPSQCWKISTSMSFDPGLGHIFNMPSIALNLTGSGFEGVNEISQQAQSSGALH